MSANEGDRVGAILSAKDGVVKFLGYGVYEGRKVPNIEGMRDHGIANPKIKLDNGRTVWGCQCWWGPEDQIKERFASCVFEPVELPDIPEYTGN